MPASVLTLGVRPNRVADRWQFRAAFEDFPDYCLDAPRHPLTQRQWVRGRFFCMPQEMGS